MNVTLITEPTSEPISLPELKLNARIELTETSEDVLLNSIITASREHVEDITRRALFTQTWAYYLDEWPDNNKIKLPFGNLQTTNLVMSYDEVDTDDSKNTVTMTLTTEYLIEVNGEQCGAIVLPYGETWPSFTHWPTQSIKIQFQCGWTSKLLIPYKIKAAIQLICLDLYSNRENQIVSNQDYRENKTVQRLLSSARLWEEF